MVLEKAKSGLLSWYRLDLEGNNRLNGIFFTEILDKMGEISRMAKRMNSVVAPHGLISMFMAPVVSVAM
jgi:hypothetical protein